VRITVGSETLHESPDNLTPKTRNLHRAITSLMEEWEAVDWYQQRVDATDDEELKAVLAHNRDEEIEHAMMNLEWIRRNLPTADEHARTYLFSQGPITEVEEAATGKAGGSGGSNKEDEEEATAPKAEAASSSKPMNGSLGIGSLKLT